MPSAGESNRTGRETRQRVLTERAQGHHATLHKQRSSSSRPNTSQGDNSERSLPGFGNDASNAGDTSDKNNGGTESHEQSAELDLERIAEESFRAKDAKSRKKYPELREPCTYNKELCRAALKAMGYKNVSRLKAEGKDGKRMLQEYVSDEWRANPKMRRVGIRAVAAFEKMEYETSDSEEEEEDAHEEGVRVFIFCIQVCTQQFYLFLYVPPHFRALAEMFFFFFLPECVFVLFGV